MQISLPRTLFRKRTLEYFETKEFLEMAIDGVVPEGYHLISIEDALRDADGIGEEYVNDLRALEALHEWYSDFTRTIQDAKEQLWPLLYKAELHPIIQNFDRILSLLKRNRDQEEYKRAENLIEKAFKTRKYWRVHAVHATCETILKTRNRKIVDYANRKLREYHKLLKSEFDEALATGNKRRITDTRRALYQTENTRLEQYALRH